MNPDQIFLIQSSFEIPLFKSNMTEQRRKLMNTLKVVVVNLDDLNSIIPAVQALGARHTGYGVKAEHYMTVMAALVWALEQQLGTEFTPDTKSAWAIAYNTLADVMLSAVPVAV
jgi:hemoglobin-like flavoprotein